MVGASVGGVGAALYTSDLDLETGDGGDGRDGGDGGDGSLDDAGGIAMECSARDRSRGCGQAPKALFLAQGLRNMITLVCCGMLIVVMVHHQDARLAMLITTPLTADMRVGDARTQVGVYPSRELLQSPPPPPPTPTPTPSPSLPVPFGTYSPPAIKFVEKKVKASLTSGTGQRSSTASEGSSGALSKTVLEGAEYADLSTTGAADMGTSTDASNGGIKDNYVEGDFPNTLCVLRVDDVSTWYDKAALYSNVGRHV